jgi:hypothetical protein
MVEFLETDAYNSYHINIFLHIYWQVQVQVQPLQLVREGILQVVQGSVVQWPAAILYCK